MKYKILGIAGPARVGKDTMADRIQLAFGYEVKKTSFADPIKIMLSEGLGLSAEQLYGDEKELEDDRYGCSPRHMMQTLGTEWGRNSVNQNIWVRALKSRVDSIGGQWVVPDVRFEGEAEYIRSEGRLIHIVGNNSISNKHKSEQGVYIDKNDIVLHNDGTLKQYYEIIGIMIKDSLIG